MSLDMRLKAGRLGICGVVCKSPKTKMLQLESSSPVHFMVSLHLPSSDLLWHCRADPLKNVTVICFYTRACLEGKIALLKISSHVCTWSASSTLAHNYGGHQGEFFFMSSRGEGGWWHSGFLSEHLQQCHHIQHGVSCGSQQLYKWDQDRENG